jgi:hypothetical protein
MTRHGQLLCVLHLQGDVGAAEWGSQAARDACSSSSSGGAGVVSERLRQEVTADVILGQAQVGLLHTLNPLNQLTVKPCDV